MNRRDFLKAVGAIGAAPLVVNIVKGKPPEPAPIPEPIAGDFALGLQNVWLEYRDDREVWKPVGSLLEVSGPVVEVESGTWLAQTARFASAGEITFTLVGSTMNEAIVRQFVDGQLTKFHLGYGQPGTQMASVWEFDAYVMEIDTVGGHDELHTINLKLAVSGQPVYTIYENDDVFGGGIPI